jgi:hypothetical protein
MTYIEVKLHSVGLDGVEEADHLIRVNNDASCLHRAPTYDLAVSPTTFSALVCHVEGFPEAEKCLSVDIERCFDDVEVEEICRVIERGEAGSSR